MSDKKLRVFKLRNQNEEELLKGLEGYKTELNQLRIAKVSGGAASKLARIKVVRKAIAKYLTVINMKSRNKQKDELKKKRKAKTLRPKKTRSIRRRLTKHQESILTVRKQKKVANFPLRKYFLRD